MLGIGLRLLFPARGFLGSGFGFQAQAWARWVRAGFLGSSWVPASVSGFFTFSARGFFSGSGLHHGGWASGSGLFLGFRLGLRFRDRLGFTGFISALALGLCPRRGRAAELDPRPFRDQAAPRTRLRLLRSPSGRFPLLLGLLSGKLCWRRTKNFGPPGFGEKSAPSRQRYFNEAPLRLQWRKALMLNSSYSLGGWQQ